jgi:hypothetical protein
MAEAHDKAARILLDASSVETYRIHGLIDYGNTRERERPRNKRRYIDGFPIDAKGPIKGRDFAEAVARFLLDEANFVPADSPPTACIFDPGVAFRLRSRGQRLDVIICFLCAELEVESSDGLLRLPSHRFSPGYSRLSALAKQAFPDDPSIATLR